MTHLHKIISDIEQTKIATNTGTNKHTQLNKIRLSANGDRGDKKTIELIYKNKELTSLFSQNSLTEVPIAGTIQKRCISRRIDRLLIDHANKHIKILDYKTDVTPHKHKSKYIIQLNEYAQLLHQIYPEYKIYAYILWTNNFLLENIPVKIL